MQFRNIQAEELEGSVEIAGLDEWLRSIGATDATVLIVAPSGSGKAAAVGRLAHRLGRRVLICDLTELMDYDEPARQLDNLLRICEAQKDTVVYLDKLDRALAKAGRAGQAEMLVGHLDSWLTGAHTRLLDSSATVVFTGRDAKVVPQSLLQRFDKPLVA